MTPAGGPRRPSSMEQTVRRFLIAAVALCAAVVAQETKPESRPAVVETDMIATPSGLQYKVVVAGPEGKRPKRGDYVKVHYRGTLENGTEFDSSYTGGQPVEFRLGGVIEGWNEGVKLMTAGSKYRFKIPGDLGYGKQGTPDGKIPPNATLYFDIELLEIREGAALPEPPKYVAMDPAKTKAGQNGVKYEVAVEGKGAPATQDDTLHVHFALFGPDHKLIWATAAAGGDAMKFPMKQLAGQTGLPFMKTMLPEMLEGEVRRCEVSSEQAFGPRGNPAVPAGSTTYWELTCAKIGRPSPPPAFVKAEDLKLTETASGLKYEIVKEGTGRAPTQNDQVEVHYAGWLENGTAFDSSFSRGDSTTFPVSRVIPGWTEGLKLMKEGGVARFVIPGKLAYGERGFGDKIPPNATLVFYVELVKVK